MFGGLLQGAKGLTQYLISNEDYDIILEPEPFIKFKFGGVDQNSRTWSNVFVLPLKTERLPWTSPEKPQP